jgi:hypothetical protein
LLLLLFRFLAVIGGFVGFVMPLTVRGEHGAAQALGDFPGMPAGGAHPASIKRVPRVFHAWPQLQNQRSAAWGFQPQGGQKIFTFRGMISV